MQGTSSCFVADELSQGAMPSIPVGRGRREALRAETRAPLGQAWSNHRFGGKRCGRRSSAWRNIADGFALRVEHGRYLGACLYVMSAPCRVACCVPRWRASTSKQCTEGYRQHHSLCYDTMSSVLAYSMQRLVSYPGRPLDVNVDRPYGRL